MVFDEKLRWFGFWTLDSLRGGHVRKYYDQIKDSYQKGTSMEATDKKIRKLITENLVIASTA